MQLFHCLVYADACKNYKLIINHTVFGSVIVSGTDY